MEPRLLLCVIVTVAGNSPDYDTIVIGLGSAGTTAATILARGGRRVLALEAASRVGGRVITVLFAKGVVELGAEWIMGTENNRVFDTASQHNVTIIPQDWTTGAYHSNGSLADSGLLDQLFEQYYQDGPDPPEAQGNFTTKKIMGTENNRVFDTASQHNVTIIPQDWTTGAYHSNGSLADSGLLDQLFEQYYQDGPDPPEAQGNFTTKKILEEITKNKPYLLRDPDYISDLLLSVELMIENYEAADDWNDVTTGGDYDDLEGHQSMSWHRHGYKTFFEIMLNTYKGGLGLPNLDIKLNKKVTVIRSPKEPNDRVTVQCADGGEYVADTVIVTVSLGVLKAIHSTLFSPPLPKDKQSAIEKISFGVLDKIILAFDEVWWPQNVTRFAFIWKTDDRKKVPVADVWTTKISGPHRPTGSNNTLTLWVSGNAAKEVEKLPEETVKTKCVELLQRFMGDALNITVPQPTAIIRTTWHSNPYTRGSYTFDNILTPQYPAARDWLGSPINDSSGAPRVLFAGEATNRKHFGTVHGASETGLREAMRLLQGAAKV